jgi:hypothetical protein
MEQTKRKPRGLSVTVMKLRAELREAREEIRKLEARHREERQLNATLKNELRKAAVSAGGILTRNRRQKLSTPPPRPKKPEPVPLEPFDFTKRERRFGREFYVRLREAFNNDHRERGGGLKMKEFIERWCYEQVQSPKNPDGCVRAGQERLAAKWFYNGWKHGGRVAER